MSYIPSVLENSSTTEQVSAKPQCTNAFNDMALGPNTPNDVLYKDIPWILQKVPAPTERVEKQPKKSSNFEFNQKRNPRKVNSNDTSFRLIQALSKNVGTKSNANVEYAVATPCTSTCPSISPGGNKNAESLENQTQCAEFYVCMSPDVSNGTTSGKAIDLSLSNQNAEELPDGHFKKEACETLDAEPVHINTPKNIERSEKDLHAELTVESQKLIPKYVPEYESVFDGPWILDKLPPYSDSSIPKGPTPPSPIQFIQKQLTNREILIENGDIGKPCALVPELLQEEIPEQ